MKTLSWILFFCFFIFVPSLLIIVGQASAQWRPTNGPYGGVVPAVFAFGDRLYASPETGGIYLSRDRGASWTLIGGPDKIGLVLTFAAKDSFLYAGTFSDVYRFPLDGGTGIPLGMPGTIRSLLLTGDSIWACTSDGLFRFIDNGLGWRHVEVDNTIYSLSISDIIASGDALYAAASSDGIYKSVDHGATWSAVNSGLAGVQAYGLAALGTALFARTSQGIFQSTDRGASWSWIHLGSAAPSDFSTDYSLAVLGTEVYAGSPRVGFYRSGDVGAHWTRIGTGLINLTIGSMAAIGSDLFAGTRSGVFHSTNQGEHWEAVNAGLILAGTNVLLRTDSSLIAGTNAGIFALPDAGNHWQAINQGIAVPNIEALAMDGSELFAGSSDSGLYRSDDGGKSWLPSASGMQDSSIRDLAVINHTLYAASGDVYRSTDHGRSWQAMNHGILYPRVRTFGVDDTVLYAATESEVYRCTNGDTTWQQLERRFSNATIAAIMPADGYLFIGVWTRTSAGIYRSDDHGATFVQMVSGLTDNRVTCLAASGHAIFAGTSGGLFYSVDDGANWRSVDIGTMSPYITSLAVVGTSLFVGTVYGVWSRPVSEITRVEIEHDLVVTRYSLEQNFPNPFNPSTVISFSIPMRSYVSLKIYDVMGREVAALASEELAAGNYAREWNASGMTSGVYFYRLQAGNYAETKRLMLVK